MRAAEERASANICITRPIASTRNTTVFIISSDATSPPMSRRPAATSLAPSTSTQTWPSATITCGTGMWVLAKAQRAGGRRRRTRPPTPRSGRCATPRARTP